MLFSWWLSDSSLKVNNKKLEKTALIFIGFALLTSLAYSGYFFKKNHFKKFSSSRITAQYIKINNLEAKPIVAFEGHYGESVLPYLPNKKMFLPDGKKIATFMTWDKDWLNSHKNSLLNKKKTTLDFYRQFSPSPESVLVITSKKIDDPDFKLLKHHSQPTMSGENIFLYQLQITPLKN